MLKDYQPGQQLVEFLAVRKASTATASNGKKYLSLTLSDGETELNGKQWDFAGEAPKENTIIKVKADVELFKGNNQLVIQQWRTAEPGESDPSKFIGKCPIGIEGMKGSLSYWLSLIKNTELNAFVNAIIEANYNKFITCPGAMRHHHAYIGGLLEHALNVTHNTLLLAPDGNKDLLIAGGLIHDIGKIWEYDWSGCSIQMTTEGKLLGHIAIGIRTLEAVKHEYCDLDESIYYPLLHMILSHHGKPEWGSPVEPVMKEAIALHQADVLDAQMWKIQKAETEATGEWTDRIYGIGREFYVYKTKEDK